MEMLLDSVFSRHREEILAVNKAKRAARIRRATPEEIELWRKDLAAGMSVSSVAKKYRRAEATIVMRLGRPSTRQDHTERNKNIVRDRLEGHTYNEIAQTYQLSYARVYQIIRAAGLYADRPAGVGFPEGSSGPAAREN